MITGNTIWLTHERRRIRLKDLSDIHLANLIHYLKKEDSDEVYRHALLKYLCILAYDRGLSVTFIKRAPYPFKDSSNRWKIWTVAKGFRLLQK